jgi:hypothetical protein
MSKTLLRAAPALLLCCAGAWADQPPAPAAAPPPAPQAAAPAAAQPAAPPHIYGGLEHVRIVTLPSMEVQGRMDSGAEMTELHASDIKYMLHSDGKTWVSFAVDASTVVSGRQVSYKLPVLKDLHLPRVHTGGGIEHEPVVNLEFCVGQVDMTAEVGLRTRQDYTAPLVLGRPELAQLGPVDVQKQFTGDPSCAPPADATPPHSPQSR